jgi:hypothetical protein
MQSNINNDNFNSNINKLIDKEHLLLQNKEIINMLILESNHKKDKSYLSIKELEFFREYENNLMKLCENCPPVILKQLLEETYSLNESRTISMDESE